MKTSIDRKDLTKVHMKLTSMSPTASVNSLCLKVTQIKFDGVTAKKLVSLSKIKNYFTKQNAVESNQGQQSMHAFTEDEMQQRKHSILQGEEKNIA